jgi:16S rRNA processing protein RimM
MDPMGGMPRGLKGYKVFFLEGADGAAAVEPLELDGWRSHSQWILLMVRGVRGRDNAAELTGRIVYVPRTELPKLEGDEYYYADLLGSAVVSGEGEDLGRVEDVKDWGEYDMLMVKDGRKHWMLPVLERYVTELDVEGKRIVVQLPEGFRP